MSALSTGGGKQPQVRAHRCRRYGAAQLAHHPRQREVDLPHDRPPGTARRQGDPRRRHTGPDPCQRTRIAGGDAPDDQPAAAEVLRAHPWRLSPPEAARRAGRHHGHGGEGDSAGGRRSPGVGQALRQKNGKITVGRVCIDSGGSIDVVEDTSSASCRRMPTVGRSSCPSFSSCSSPYSPASTSSSTTSDGIGFFAK
jgi:hypothetical protein